MRGTGEGHRPWDLEPQATMTNANVEAAVTGVDGQTLTMKYKDGEKKLVVTPETVVVAYAPGDKAELKPGTRIFIRRAAEAARRHPADAAHHLRQGRPHAADVAALIRGAAAATSKAAGTSSGQAMAASSSAPATAPAR